MNGKGKNKRTNKVLGNRKPWKRQKEEKKPKKLI